MTTTAIHTTSLMVSLARTPTSLFVEKASGAESFYREAARDPKQTAYALVYVNKGAAALTDVLINEVSIQKIVEEYNSKHE